MAKRLFVVFLALASACAGSKRRPVPFQCPEREPLLETVTLNAGLAPGVVPLATPRAAPLAEELSKLNGVGIVCLQEVWRPEDRDRVVRSLGLPEENVFWHDTGGVGEEPGVHVCTEGQIGPVLECAEARCGSEHPEELSICVKDACEDELVRTYLSSKNCLQCLVTQVGRPIDEVRRVCTGPVGSSRAIGGHNGVILASRWPLEAREAVPLPSSVVNRVALLATVRIDGHEPIEVACAHLSTSGVAPSNHPGFDGWDEEMIAQVRIISGRLKERAAGRPQLFLGDMNAGPSIGQGGGSVSALPESRRIAGEMPRVWAFIRKQGFRSPAAEAADPFCSTCRGNTLRGEFSRNFLIDHVLVRDPKGGTELEPACAHPYLDEPRLIRGRGGEAIESNLSDHYGVVVKFRLRSEK